MEAELRVERRGALVDGLHDDGAGADHAGRGEAAPRRVDEEVGAEAPVPGSSRRSASWPSRITGTGSGMPRPTRDDTRRRSTELAARL